MQKLIQTVMMYKNWVTKSDLKTQFTKKDLSEILQNLLMKLSKRKFEFKKLLFYEKFMKIYFKNFKN